VGSEGGFVQRGRRELECQTTRRRHAALDGLQQLGKMAVAGIEAGICVGDADDGTGKLSASVTHRFGEGATHINGEIAVTVILQTAQEAAVKGAVVRLVHVASLCREKVSRLTLHIVIALSLGPASSRSSTSSCRRVGRAAEQGARALHRKRRERAAQKSAH